MNFENGYNLPESLDYANINYALKNIENSRFFPSSVHLDCALTAYNYRYLFQRALSVFEWKIPESVPLNYFLYVIYNIGYGFVFNTKTYGTVVGLEENIFPSPMCVNTMRELEEERRLLYVAITRAEKHCILTCAQNRFRYGRMEYDIPSRFIKDIAPNLLKIEGGTGLTGFKDLGFSRESSFSRGSRYSRVPVQNPRPVATQFVADPKPRMVPVRQETPRPQSAIGDIGLKEGNVIEHQRFGIGTVVKVEGSGENTKATVAFKNAGTKQLLLKFAKYTIIK